MIALTRSLSLWLVILLSSRSSSSIGSSRQQQQQYPLIVRAQETDGNVDLQGGIVTRTNVKLFADLSLDLRDIRVAPSKDAMTNIYRIGSNAQLSAGVNFPLQRIGGMIHNSEYPSPGYVFHQYGLAERSMDLIDLEKHVGYADQEISYFIAQGANNLVADAIIALDLWMYASHILYAGALLCEEKTQADAPDRVDIGETLVGGGMDEFIALWIGTDQTAGSEDGHGLYAWTERIANIFGTSTAEANANTLLKILYEEGVIALSLPNACTKSNSRTATQLWNVATQMLSQMAVPLYQWLIHSIIERSAPAARLYGKALIPHLSQCRPSDYERLMDLVVNQGDVDFSKGDEIIERLHATLGCFNLGCRDLGMMPVFPQSGCDFDRDTEPPILAGFTTSTDVSALSRLDLDIYQMEILASMGHFEYAKIIYKYGKNAPRARDSENDPFALVSLQELAVSADRKRTSSFTNNFLKYHTDKNSEYGDKAITNALGDGGKWKNRPNLMRAKAIALASSFHVVFLECIALFRDAYEACEESDSEVGFIAEHNPLDQAAALLIGYLEGETVKGVSSLDGKFTFGLASEKAFQFDTLTEQDDYAVVNSEIEDLLYAAKGQLDVLDCIKVSRTVSHIEDLMMIPLLQGVAQAAASNENINSDAFETSLVEGEMYALTVLPSIDELQTSSADTIYRNMIVTSGDTVPDGSAEVGDAVGRFTTQGMKLSCRYIGGNDDVEPCRNYGGRSLGERRWSLLGLLVSAVAGLTLLW